MGGVDTWFIPAPPPLLHSIIVTDTSISIVFPPAVVVIFAPGAVIVEAAPMPISMDILVDIAPATHAARTNSDLVMTRMVLQYRIM